MLNFNCLKGRWQFISAATALLFTIATPAIFFTLLFSVPQTSFAEEAYQDTGERVNTSTVDKPDAKTNAPERIAESASEQAVNDTPSIARNSDNPTDQISQSNNDGAVVALNTLNVSASPANVRLDVSLSENSISLGETVTVTPNPIGFVNDVEYNYVWQRNGSWADGQWSSVLHETEKMTKDTSWSFQPAQAGTYTVYVTARDGSGISIEASRQIKVTEEYELKGIRAERPSATEPWALEAETVGNTAHLTYKFVWEKGNWAEWGIVQDWSSSATATWKPGSEGSYNIYCDISDSTGAIKTIVRAVDVKREWSLSFALDSNIALGENVQIKPRISGAQDDDVEYNYVWQRNGSWADGQWSSVLHETEKMTKDTSWSFQPAQAGTYTVYVTARDGSGISIEASRQIKVTEEYDFKSVKVGKDSNPTIDQPLTLTAETVGNTAHLTYKFVWEKGNWAEWGIVQDWSSNATAKWTPSVSGNVTFYVDIADSTGKTITKFVTTHIDHEHLQFDGISCTPNNSAKVGDTITLAPQFTASSNKHLAFKYVWERNNWKDWGVLQEESGNDSLTFALPFSGNITFYIDIRDSTGNVTTRTIQLNIEPEAWSYDDVRSSSELMKIGAPVTIETRTSGETAWLKYKYVWEKNNWSKWGVISQNGGSTIRWNPSEPGEYTLYVDVTDSSGRTVTKTTCVSYWSFANVQATQQKDNWTWSVNANIGISNSSASKFGFTFKFVWAKPDWSQWGILRDFSNSNSATFNPAQLGLGAGQYELYVDVKNPVGGIESRHASVNYQPEQSIMLNNIQWRSSSTNWLIAVNTQTCRVGIFYGRRGGWTMQKYWLCSPGKSSTPTVKGEYTVQNKGYSFGSGYTCYYWTQFYGDYLFHSILFNQGTFTVQDGRLGQQLSHGCVRLDFNNAKWIYDNIPRGTKVVIW